MSVTACAELVERGDPDRFAAAMSAPPQARAMLWPVYAFNLEVARAPWLTNEPIIAEMRLQFWRDVLDEIEAAKAPRAHEVAAPLHALHQTRPLALSAFHDMINARRLDIAREAFAGPDALWAYLNQGAGSLMWASVSALGGTDETAARTLGQAAGLANWLEAHPKVIAAGWFAAQPDIYPHLIDMALADLARLKRVDFQAATAAARAAWRAKAILQKAKSSPQAITNGTLASSEFRRRTSLTWRTLRGRW
jgi:hypothetical protein